MTSKLFELATDGIVHVDQASNYIDDISDRDMLQKKFRNLASQWIKEIADISSTVEMAKHPIYQEIINMGKPVIPFMLEDLSQNPLYWLMALRQVTQENPVQPRHKGKIKQMAEDWLNWGRQNGYVVSVSTYKAP
jgi:hypothetical protein